MSFRYFSVGKSLCLTAGTLVLMVLFLASVSLVFSAPTLASANTGYYYDQLDSLSQKFYNALDDMYKAGNLKSGNYEYDLIENEVITSQQAKEYAEGSQELIRAFFVAKDAFMLDKNIFYIDFDKLDLSIGSKDNKYVATLGTGRNDTYYLDGVASSVSIIDAKLADYQAQLRDLVGSISSSATTEVKIKSANSAILSNTTFGYGLDENNVATDKTAYIRSSYGALVNNVAVSEGFARLFKDVMDALGIENVLVKGYVLNDNETYQPAMWNYIKLGNSWYAVDVALNSLSVNQSQYLLIGQNNFRYNHLASGFINTDYQIFNYPELSENNYGYIADVSVNCEYDTKMTVSALNPTYDHSVAPVLVGNKNLDLSRWTYQNDSGTTVNASNTLKSQLNLVSSKVLAEEKQLVLDTILDNNLQFSSADVLDTKAFNIDLHLCGSKSVNLNGSLIKLEYSFCTQNFKGNLVYLCTRKTDGSLDLDNITKLNSFATEKNTIVETEKFGVLVYINVPANKIVTVERQLCLSNVNGGGSVTVKMKDKVMTDIVKLQINESIIVEFVPDAGYTLDFCMINGQPVEIKDNKITIYYNDIMSRSILDFSFVSNRVLNYETEQGVTNLQKSNVQNQYERSGLNWGLIICLALVTLVLVGLLITYIVLKTKEMKKEKAIKQKF